MEQDEATLHLDYGGMTDSAGKKVSVWSVTMIVNGRKQEHFDFFFDQHEHQKSTASDKARKDVQTGIYFL